MFNLYIHYKFIINVQFIVLFMLSLSRTVQRQMIKK